MANLAAILNALGGGIKGYNNEQITEQKIKDMLSQAAARQAYGNSLPQVLSPQAQPPTPVALPGSSPMPGGSPMLQAQTPAPGQQSMPMRPPAPQGLPPRPQGMPQAGGAGQPQMPQQAPSQPLPQGMSAPGQNQPLTWQAIIQAVKKVAPNIDGATLASVVDQYTPMMAAQSKAEWQQVQQQFKQEQLDQRERQNDAMDRIRQQIADVQAQRADTGDRRADTGEKKQKETERHDKEVEDAKQQKGASGRPLTAAQQKRSEAINNTIAQTDELIGLIKKYPNAVGAAGNISRRRTGVTSMLGVGLNDEEDAAQRIQELNTELQNGLPTVEKYTTVGGGKASDFSNLDVSKWNQGAGALLPKLTQLRKNLSNVQKTFSNVSGKAANSDSPKSTDDFSKLWQ